MKTISEMFLMFVLLLCLASCSNNKTKPEEGNKNPVIEEENKQQENDNEENETDKQKEETNLGYKDGQYFAEDGEYDESGWRDQVNIHVSDGRIVEVDWDSVNEEGSKKKELSRSGDYDMVAGGASAQWYEQAQAMENKLIEVQDPAKIQLNEDGKTDDVTGATINVEGFVKLAQRALQQADE